MVKEVIPNQVWHERERYMSVLTHPGMFVSAEGKLLSFRNAGPYPKAGWMSNKPHFLNGSPDKDGYLFITRPKKLVHAVVLTAWVCPRPAGMEARHLDGNKLNNSVSNLAWGTMRENADDKKLHGKSKGSKNHRAKLTEEQVMTMRRMRKDVPLSVVEKTFPQFSPFAIWACTTGYTWAHLPEIVPNNRKCSKDNWRAKNLEKS